MKNIDERASEWMNERYTFWPMDIPGNIEQISKYNSAQYKERVFAKDGYKDFAEAFKKAYESN